MTTPRIPRPGQVRLPAEWVDDEVPERVRAILPPWLPQQGFLLQLSALLEEYRTRETERSLGVEVHQQNRIAIPWLRAALREIRRGEFARVRHSPTSPMPGKTHPACWHEAYRRGLDWEALVATGRPEDAETVAELVTAAIASIRRSQAPKRAGRKSLLPRDQLLRSLVALVKGYCRRERGAGVAPSQRPLEIAESILIACRIEVPQNPKAASRAARRGGAGLRGQ